MAFGVPYSLGAVASSAGSNTLQLTVQASSAAGDALYVSASVNTTSSAASPTACQDSQGNVYALIVTTGINAEYQTTLFVATESSTGGPTTPLANGVDTITVTYHTSVTAIARNLNAGGCSGAAVGSTAATVDQSAFNGNATTGTATTATLAALQQTAELIVAAVTAHDTANSIVWTTPLSAVNGPVVSGANQQGFLGAGVSTTSASTAYGGTVNATGKWDCAVVSILPLGAQSISEADVAGAVDSLSVSVSVPLADAGAAVDDQPGEFTLSATVALADTAAGTDSFSAAVAASLADVAGADDFVAPAAALSLADVAAGEDALSPAATVALADVAGADDSVTPAVALSLADTAGAVDGMSLAAAIAVADVAGGTDALLLAIGIAETAGAVDSISVTISEAGSPLPWFTAALMVSRWRASIEGQRWSAALLPGRWVSALATRVYNVTSTEQIPARVTGPADPTGLEVQMAFLTSPPPAQPTVDQWLAAEWGTDTGPPWTALCLIGPAGLMTLVSGVNYYVWVQVTASPEVPVEYAGMLEAQ
jgi:hypothetical protein